MQGDHFAPPSAVRIRMKLSHTQILQDILATRIKRIVSADYLIRICAKKTPQIPGGISGTGNSGTMEIDACNQMVLERTAMVFFDKYIEVRIRIGFPAFGYKVNAKVAVAMFFQQLPAIVENLFLIKHLDEREIRHHVQTIVIQEFMREKLHKLGIVAFIGNNSILPRKSGIDDNPLLENVFIKIYSPESRKLSIKFPDGLIAEGLEIPGGISLIVGGGYHGKLSMSKAIERGIYNYIPGAVKIRAEDGRSIEKVDISFFF